MGKRANRLLQAVIVSTAMAGSSALAGTTAPLYWLKSNIEGSTDIGMHVAEQTLTFKGCRQAQYAVSLSRELDDNWAFEAIAHYRRGAMDFGSLSQTVRSQSFEVVAWRNFDAMRVGVMHSARPRHQMAVPAGKEVNLPTSETLGVYVDMEVGKLLGQVVRVALLRETWDANGSSLPIAWQQSQDSQLHLSYSMAF